MKVIIMGCGRVGAMVATLLDEQGHEVVVMDTRSDAFRRLPLSYGGKTSVGNGMDGPALERAGIAGADAFIAVTQGDNRNVMACQIAKHIYHVPRVVCRIYDPIREAMYRNLGLDSVSPTKVVAELLKERIEG